MIHRMLVTSQLPEPRGFIVLHTKMADKQHQDVFGGTLLPPFDALQGLLVNFYRAGNISNALAPLFADGLEFLTQLIKWCFRHLTAHSDTLYIRSCGACKRNEYNENIMNILQNVPLRDHSTMRLGGQATYLCEVSSRQEVEEALAWAAEHHLPSLMIGGGSNIIWRDEGFNGLIIVNKIMRFEVQQEDDLNYYITVGAGENWDNVVARTAEQGLTGIEALSLIPGTAGATPVQNVGAYGQEIAQTLATLEAYDAQSKQFVTLLGIDCNFGYRTSRFKTTDRGRFFITAITLHLTKGTMQPPFYGALQSYLEEHGITDYAPASIRQAVIAIRSSKLPDPAHVANNGSFFANPIIPQEAFEQLRGFYENIPHWPTEDGRVKIPAAWLVEQAGFKDFHDPETGMATWQKQPLVLVNERARSTAQLLKFRQKIIDAVKTKFNITLEQEPELLP